jgi:predicted oxidoreductase
MIEVWFNKPDFFYFTASKFFMDYPSYISPVIAGCMNWGQWGSKFSTTEYLQLIEDCLANEITTFDHADIYGDYTTEEEFGAALKIKPSLRTQMQIITKCGICRLTTNRPAHKIHSYNTSRSHILNSVDNSLKNLNTDFIDILLIHRPDPLMHPDEIAEAITHLIAQGKLLKFGVSNFTPSQVELIHSRHVVKFNQIEISVLQMDAFHNGQLDQCIQHNIMPMAWSPLGAGKLMKDLEEERNKRILAVTQYLADKYNVSIDQILLAFLFNHPARIVPVLGTTKISRLKAALDASSIKLEREEWFMLWRASMGHEVA